MSPGEARIVLDTLELDDIQNGALQGRLRFGTRPHAAGKVLYGFLVLLAAVSASILTAA